MSKRGGTEALDLTTRIALRIDEAAATMGLSEGAFREHILPGCPKLYAGRAVLIPRDLLVRFIGELATKEGAETETAAELLSAAGRDL